MNVVLTGPKGVGKSTVAERLAARLGLPWRETDALVESLYQAETGRRLSCRDIWREHGEAEFRRFELEAVRQAVAADPCVISLGGSTLFQGEAVEVLRAGAIIVLLRADPAVLWERVRDRGMPAYLPDAPDGGRAAFVARAGEVMAQAAAIADLAVETAGLEAGAVTAAVFRAVADRLGVPDMTAQALGDRLRQHDRPPPRPPGQPPAAATDTGESSYGRG